MKRINKRGFYTDTRGFSTTFDVFLFLVMVSISAVILLPIITGNTQVMSALEAKNQKQSSQILLTLLNGRVDNFEYTVAGEQMDKIAGDTIKESSIYKTAKKMIAGHELKHKTFADLAAENAASQWVIYHNGKSTKLNILMIDYSNNLDRTLKEYLDKQIGDRYNYNLTVVWRPIVNVPVGGDVTIGDPVPKNAYTESTYITMPYQIDFTRKNVEDIIESKFQFDEAITDREAIENKIYDNINIVIDNSIDEVVPKIVNEALTPVLDGTENTMINQVDNLLPSDKNGELNKEIKEKISESIGKEKDISDGSLSDELIDIIKKDAKQRIHETSREQLKDFVTNLADLYVNNQISVQDMKDRVLTEVFSRFSISRAQVTLSIWEKRK